jgi:hypothetical protein
MKNVSVNIVQKIKTHFVLKILFLNIFPFMRKWEKYGRARRAIHNKTMLRGEYAIYMSDN